ncbi:MAG: S-methyl-5-thioribose-1-phosphate isomerase [Candidatus Omnitrophica bacterium]|nr:S-methyl-5-thioribose-1-phosphate isomerase [Candidatus Omnitrophota bacterium]
MEYPAIRWSDDKLELLDQRLLPSRVEYAVCRNARQVHDAIRNMKVRGAPAIGVAGAFGVYLGVAGARAKDPEKFMDRVAGACGYISGARPTARNLFWGVERMEEAARKQMARGVPRMKKALLREALSIMEEDRKTCRAIGRHGKSLIGRDAVLMTHCNAGALATAGCGTALSVIFAAAGRIRMVYADETRPVLQGARLTVWELVSRDIPVTLICDNMAASIMKERRVDAVIVGADRIASNGDTANKIGTYSLAVLAKHHRIPFYVAAPFSTFDMTLRNGSGIEIEQRCHDEVRKVGGRLITVEDVNVCNPAFDVTPAKAITAIITEKGVIESPNRKKIKEMSSGRKSRVKAGRDG